MHNDILVALILMLFVLTVSAAVWASSSFEEMDNRHVDHKGTVITATFQ